MPDRPPLKLKVRKLGKPIHVVDKQLIVKDPSFVPKKGAKVVLKGEKGQILIGVADYPFGPVERPYIAINVLEDLPEDVLRRVFNKDLYVEKFVKYKSKMKKK